MPAASRISFDVHYGMAVRNPRSVAKVSTMTQKVRSGALRSAWGDHDEPDSTGLGMRSGNVVPGRVEREQQELAFMQERERVRLAQEQAINQAIEEQRKEAAARALHELEELDGYGTF